LKSKHFVDLQKLSRLNGIRITRAAHLAGKAAIIELLVSNQPSIINYPKR
tara:strand:+ start:103 stop:252 length:150 start_codon:yes stop_codon:yes gene_type:complete